MPLLPCGVAGNPFVSWLVDTVFQSLPLWLQGILPCVFLSSKDTSQIKAHPNDLTLI